MTETLDFHFCHLIVNSLLYKTDELTDNKKLRKPMILGIT